MKKIIVALLIAYPLVAKGLNLQTGLLSYTSSTPYKGMPYQFFLVPLISVEYGNFYISGTETGYMFFSANELSVSLEFSPTLLGYQSEDSEYFNGMKDRDITLESGFKLEYQNGLHKLKLKALYDFFDVYDGYSAIFEYSYIKLTSSSGTFVTNIGAENYSSSKSSYYFGVFDNESTSDRKSYYLNHTINYYASVDYIYNISSRWTFFANLEYKHYDEQVYKSPIVDQRFAISNFLGVVYVW